MVTQTTTSPAKNSAPSIQDLTSVSFPDPRADRDGTQLAEFLQCIILDIDRDWNPHTVPLSDPILVWKFGKQQRTILSFSKNSEAAMSFAGKRPHDPPVAFMAQTFRVIGKPGDENLLTARRYCFYASDTHANGCAREFELTHAGAEGIERGSCGWKANFANLLAAVQNALRAMDEDMSDAIIYLSKVIRSLE